MLTELYRKGGRVCGPAREGRLRCPLIVRPTSEDVITGHLSLVLRALSPRWWLPDLLNSALGANRFRRQVFRQLRIEPWQNLKAYPQELLPWREGSTQVDLMIRWQNPPTTVFIETKYHAPPSARVEDDTGEHDYPSDQVIRNLRVGLHESGWIQRETMFETRPADFIFILLSPRGGEPLVHRYRSTRQLLNSIPQPERLVGLPSTPFVGELTYDTLRATLMQRIKQYTRPERVLIETFGDYLQQKRQQFEEKVTRQPNLPSLEQEPQEIVSNCFNRV